MGFCGGFNKASEISWICVFFQGVKPLCTMNSFWYNFESSNNSSCSSWSSHTSYISHPKSSKVFIACCKEVTSHHVKSIKILLSTFKSDMTWKEYFLTGHFFSKISTICIPLSRFRKKVSFFNFKYQKTLKYLANLEI